jgi:lipopolysaccharide transport system ATP-binding protein
MTKKEIDRKFDEIVAFSEIEKFIDTPVKRYSSGMYVRLAFAVAAHLEPEILVVDEVLAVGDAAFQEKCLGKMDAVSKGGRTVLFVSHNMGSIKSLCAKGILLKNGLMEKEGEIKDVVEFYASSQKEMEVVDLRGRKDRIGTGDARIVKIIMRNSKGTETNTIEMGEAFSVEVFYEGEVKAAHVAVMIYNIVGDWILEANSFYSHKEVLNLHGSSFTCHFKKNFLLAGVYSISLCLGRFDENVDLVRRCLDFMVESKDVYTTGRIPDPRSGIIYAEHSWEFK